MQNATIAIIDCSTGTLIMRQVTYDIGEGLESAVIRLCEKEDISFSDVDWGEIRYTDIQL